MTTRFWNRYVRNLQRNQGFTPKARVAMPTTWESGRHGCGAFSASVVRHVGVKSDTPNGPDRAGRG